MDMIEKLIKYEDSQVGYLEKASNKDLEPKEGPNVGDKNYTKYSQDLIEKIGKPFMNGVAWCVIFQMDSFVRVFGVEQAKKLLHVWTMSCTELIRHFKDPDEVPENPKAGDLVVFQNAKGDRHIGLIYKTDQFHIYTIEGNTKCNTKPKAKGEEEEVIMNGGGVFKKSYLKSNSKIYIYLRPKYTIVPKPVLKRSKVNSRAEVKLLQTELNSLGYVGKEGKKLAVDGSFGANTEHAVKEFQRVNSLAVDGSYGPRTAAMLYSILSEEA